MELVATSPNGELRYPLQAAAGSFVADLKAAIEALGGPPAPQQRLLLGERLLEDAASLEQAGLADGAELTLVALATFGEEHRVRSLLLELCPEKIEELAERLACVELQSAEELQAFVRLIFQRALAAPRGELEVFAELLRALKPRCKEFPSDVPGLRATTFQLTLLLVVKEAYERWEERPGTLSLIGHLFARKLMSLAFFGRAVKDLVDKMWTRIPPRQLVLDGVQELLSAAGRTLEATEEGKSLLRELNASLQDAAACSGADAAHTAGDDA